MDTKIRKSAKGIAWLLTLVYFASYLMRKNFDVMIANICSEGVKSGAFLTLEAAEEKIALVSVALTILYGIGQIVNGFIGDKIKPQTMLTIGLSLAAICNIAMFFCSGVTAMIIVWGVNGFAHSMLWPPIVRLMSIYLSDAEYGYSAVRVSWGSSIATIVLYTVCPLLLYILSWRYIILICAFGGILILSAWIMLNKRLLQNPLTPLQNVGKDNETKKKSPLPSFVIMPIALIMLGIILQGALRDGVTNWTPSILSQTYSLPEESAIFYTVIPAIFSMISFSLFDFIHRKFFTNEVVCSAVIFGGSSVFALVLFAFNSLLPNAVCAVLLLSLIIGCMHGVNLMLITVVPKRFIKIGRVSTFSGILNACTYIGASLATPGFAMLKAASKGSWNPTILSWSLISILGAIVCLLSARAWSRFCKDDTEKDTNTSIDTNTDTK